MKDDILKLAVFDVDGTIFRSSLLIQLVERLILEGVFPKSAIDTYKSEREAWLNRSGTYTEYISAVVKAFKENIRGVYYGDFADIAEDMVDTQAKRTYVYTRDLLEELKKDNYYLLAISHSPKTVLDKFCINYGFDKVYGTIYEIGPEDKFTGEVTDEHIIMNKANILKRFVENNEFDLTESVAVGDTESDIPLLEWAQKPIAFNPNNALYKVAKLNKWKVVVERKDVIYNIQ